MSATLTNTVTLTGPALCLRLHRPHKKKAASKVHKKPKWVPLPADQLTFVMAPPSILECAAELLDDIWDRLNAEKLGDTDISAAELSDDIWDRLDAEEEDDEEQSAVGRMNRRKKKWSRPRAAAHLLDRYPIGCRVRVMHGAVKLPPKMAAQRSDKLDAQWNAACNRHLPSSGRTVKPKPISLKRRSKKTKVPNPKSPSPLAHPKTRPQAPAAPHALDRNKMDTPHDHALAMLLLEIQERDITPDDYDVLLRLDEIVAPKTLSKHALQRLAVVTRSAEKPNEQCPICLEAFHIGDLCTRLPCNHEFHKDCIERWLSVNGSTCPLDGLRVTR